MVTNDKALMAPGRMYISVEEMVGNPELQAKVTAGDVIVAYMSRRALEAITAPTPPAILKMRGKFSYAPHTAYREKLAQAYGYDYDWVCNVVLDWEHQLVIASGTLTVRYRNPLTGLILSTRTTTGQDAQAMLKLQSGAGYVDIGNQMKSADSEALKIAIKNLGFFLDLYQDDDRPTLAEAEANAEKVADLKKSKIIDGKSTPVIVTLPDHFMCSDCQKEIQPAVTKGANPKPVSPQQMAETSRNRFGTWLCFDCYGKRILAERTASEAVQKAEDRSAEPVQA